MHFCTANVAIGGDTRNIMIRSEFSPVSWPEIDILRLVHGNDAVTEVQPFVSVKQAARDERERLSYIYNDGPCSECWGGRNAPRELEAPDVQLPSDVIWQNPLTGEVENSGKDGQHSVKTEAPTLPRPVLAETVGDMTKPPAPIDDQPEEEPAPPARERRPGGQFAKKK